MVPPDSFGVSRAPKYSGYLQPSFAFAYGGLTLYAVPSQVLLLASDVLLCRSYNPDPETWFGLGSSAFARHY